MPPESPAASPAETPQAPAKQAEPSFSEQWAQAEVKAEAFETAQKQAMESALAEQEADPGAETPPKEKPAPAPKDPQPAAESDSAAAEAETKVAPSEQTPKREQLNALAAELGLTIDERAVVPADRQQFRAEKRKHKAQLKAQQDALQEKAGQFETLNKARAAFETKDYWNGLKALGIDPNDVTRAAAEQLDPAMAEARRTAEVRSGLRVAPCGDCSRLGQERGPGGAKACR